jgi:hypothetical protein
MQQEIPQSIPEDAPPRPEVGACYSYGWGKMKKYAMEVFLVTVAALLIGIPGYTLMAANDEMGNGHDVLGVIGLLFLIFLTRPFKYGAFLVFLRAVKDRKVLVKGMFDVFQNYFNVVLANLFVIVIVALGTVFFIIPGIFLACRLSFTPFLVTDRKMEAIEAVKESWRLTAGHFWTVLLIALVAIPISILGLACFGIGLIGAMMWVGMAHASLYYAVTSSKETGAGSTEATSAPV